MFSPGASSGWSTHFSWTAGNDWISVGVASKCKQRFLYGHKSRQTKNVMKGTYLRFFVMIVIQQSTMIFFMRVARWDLFVSGGLSGLLATAAGLTMYFVQKRMAARNAGK